jgi:hypothetical protein
VRWPRLRRGLAGALLFPALAPAMTQDGAVVDINAHLGGALMGAAIIFVMLASWREQDEVPSHGGIAAALAGLLFTVTLFSFPLAQRNFDRYAAPGRELVPYNRMLKTANLVTTNSYQLARDYPHDPRAQYLRGVALLQANDATAAEPYLRAALSLNEKNPAFQQSFSVRIRAILALDLTVLHRRDEARNMAAPVCASRDTQALAWVNKASLCTPGG